MVRKVAAGARVFAGTNGQGRPTFRIDMIEPARENFQRIVTTFAGNQGFYSNSFAYAGNTRFSGVREPTTCCRTAAPGRTGSYTAGTVPAPVDAPSTMHA